jgi:putative phosphoesterase
MRVLVLSDIHGNLPALEYVLEKEKTADLVISLGDVVNYGPWSNECVQLMDSLKHKVLIKGNHEEAFLAGKYPGTNEVAKTFFDVCYPSFSQKDKITSYQQDYLLNDSCFTHTLNNLYVFPDTDVEISRDTFIGHSHRIFSKQCNGFRLVNVGSVGQNRTNIDELNYVVWNSDTKQVSLVTEAFNADPLISEMKIKNYPAICMDYILSKRQHS